MKNKQNIHKPTPEEARLIKEKETYFAPSPPSKGKIIGVDCHPDTFTAAVVKGTTPYDAQHLTSKGDLSLEQLLDWASNNFTKQDIFLMEAGSNSFEIYRRLTALGLRACVLESTHIGHHAKKYADNDKIAAVRIAMVYLGTKAPCVWVPDAKTLERRELLHAYQKTVTADTQASNGLKGYLNQFTIRLKKRNATSKATETWILNQREWSELQKPIQNHLTNVRYAKEKRLNLSRLITLEILKEPKMQLLMSILGIGKINAFALLAIIGDVRRFDNPKKLAAYLGLNPGSRESGAQKRIKVGVGKRGRRDMRSLLIQASQAIMRMGKNSPLGQWGWRLFARKGHRNVAVAAIARKLSAQVWHALMGNKPDLLESNKSRDIKFQKMLIELGKKLRAELGMTGTLRSLIEAMNAKLQPLTENLIQKK